MPSALLTALVMSPAAAKNQANYGKKWRYMRGNMRSLFYLDVYGCGLIGRAGISDTRGPRFLWSQNEHIHC